MVVEPLLFLLKQELRSRKDDRSGSVLAMKLPLAMELHVTGVALLLLLHCTNSHEVLWL